MAFGVVWRWIFFQIHNLDTYLMYTFNFESSNWRDKPTIRGWKWTIFSLFFMQFLIASLRTILISYKLMIIIMKAVFLPPFDLLTFRFKGPIIFAPQFLRHYFQVFEKLHTFKYLSWIFICTYILFRWFFTCWVVDSLKLQLE